MVINVWHLLVSKQHLSLGFSRGALSGLGPGYFLRVPAFSRWGTKVWGI